MKKWLYMVGVLGICGTVGFSQVPKEDLSKQLLQAASACDYEKIEALCNSGKLTPEDLNAESEDGFTPLMYTVSHRFCVKGTKKLLSQKGININKITATGNNALLVATENENALSVRALILKDDDSARTATNVNISTPEEGETPLMRAAINNSGEIMKELFKRDDLNVNAKDLKGATALIYSVNCKMAGFSALDGLRKLLNHPKIKINERDNAGNTALMYVAMRDWPGALRVLFKDDDDNFRKALNVNAKNNEGVSALMMAAENGTRGLVQEFFTHPHTAENAIDLRGRTALIHAIIAENAAMVRELLDNKKVDLTLKDFDFKRNALDWAKYRVREKDGDAEVKARILAMVEREVSQSEAREKEKVLRTVTTSLKNGR